MAPRWRRSNSWQGSASKLLPRLFVSQYCDRQPWVYNHVAFDVSKEIPARLPGSLFSYGYLLSI
jgi:hypothetical protein